MVTRQVGAAVAGTVLAHGVAALFAPSLYGKLLGMPAALVLVTGVVFTMLLACAITPEQRRDTRASAAAFRSGVVVQVIYVTEPPHRGLPAGGSSPPEGMPGIVPGEVVERGDRDADSDDGSRR